MNKKLITAPVVALILISSIATLTTTTVIMAHALVNLCGIFMLRITCSPLQQECSMDPMWIGCSQIESQNKTLQCGQSHTLLLPSSLFGPASSYAAGYKQGIADWNKYYGRSHHFICPLTSDYCKGYVAALIFENSDH